MAWHILMQGHLRFLSLMWCQAIYNLWLSCCSGPGILEVVNVWRPGRCRWLGISWCKAICGSWVWCGAKPFTTFGCCIVLRWVFWEVVSVWQPGRCRWLGISWCKAICGSWVWCGAKPLTTFDWSGCLLITNNNVNYWLQGGSAAQRSSTFVPVTWSAHTMGLCGGNKCSITNWALCGVFNFHLYWCGQQQAHLKFMDFSRLKLCIVIVICPFAPYGLANGPKHVK